MSLVLLSCSAKRIYLDHCYTESLNWLYLNGNCWLNTPRFYWVNGLHWKSCQR